MSDLTLYDTDYEAWLFQQIEALQQRSIEKLDIEHLVEELEGLNKSNKREFYSYLVVLLTHLLKWEYQPEERTGSWSGSIYNSRRGIKRVIADQPSLKNYWLEILLDAHGEARKTAQKETRLDINSFPLECQYSVKELSDENWLPGIDS